MNNVVYTVTEEHRAYCKKILVRDGVKDIGRAYVYIIYNSLHDAPYGLLEDVFVDEAYRGNGIGSELLRRSVLEAKQCGCYKLIATSRAERENVHEWYGRSGFRKYGVEFRMDFLS